MRDGSRAVTISSMLTGRGIGISAAPSWFIPVFAVSHVAQEGKEEE